MLILIYSNLKKFIIFIALKIIDSKLLLMLKMHIIRYLKNLYIKNANKIFLC